MGSPAVRPARLADAAALGRIDARTWTSDVSPAPAPHPVAGFFSPDSTIGDVLVAEVGGQPAGYVHIGPVDRIEASAHVQAIKGLAVDPGCQRRGLGRLLLTAAIETAQHRGARRVVLHVLGSNLPARTLYEACGFTTEGILREQFLLDGRYVDDVIMALTLAS